MKHTIGTFAVILGLATGGPALAYMGTGGATSGGTGNAAATGDSGTTTTGGNYHGNNTGNNGTMNNQTGTMNNQNGNRGQIVQLSALPQNVQTTINQHLQGGNVQSVQEVSMGNGQTCYVVTYDKGNGNQQHFRVNANGQFLGRGKGNWSNQNGKNNNGGW